MESKQVAKLGKGGAGIYTSPSVPNMHNAHGFAMVCIPKQLQFGQVKYGKTMGFWGLLFSDKTK